MSGLLAVCEGLRHTEIKDEESDSGSTGTCMGDEDLCMLHEAAPDSEARALVFRLTSTLPGCAAGRYLQQRCVICLCTCKHPVMMFRIVKCRERLRPKVCRCRKVCDPSRTRKAPIGMSCCFWADSTTDSMSFACLQQLFNYPDIQQN